VLAHTGQPSGAASATATRHHQPPHARQATPQLAASAVVDSASGVSKQSHVRTSTGTFFARGHDDVVRRIEKRIAQVTMIPVGACVCVCVLVWCGVVWCGVVWRGVVWCGVAWRGVAWCGVAWCGVVWCGVVWCGVVWCGVVWCGVVWCGVV
jgi:hypothetical protein